MYYLVFFYHYIQYVQYIKEDDIVIHQRQKENTQIQLDEADIMQIIMTNEVHLMMVVSNGSQS